MKKEMKLKHILTVLEGILTVNLICFPTLIPFMSWAFVLLFLVGVWIVDF